MNIKKYLSFFDKVFRMSLCRTFVWRAGPHAGVMIRFAGRRGGRGFRIGGRGVGRVSEMTNFIPGSCREAEISGVGVRAVSVSVLAGGVFFGFRRFGLFGRAVLPVNRGPCLYIVRKKTPAYVTDVAIFYPGVLHLRENSLHLYGPSDDFGFRSQKIGPGGCSAWFCGALFYVPYLT